MIEGSEGAGSAMVRPPVGRAAFGATYRQCVAEVVARLPEDWSTLARHNPGWSKQRFDARAYLLASEDRYWRAYRLLVNSGARRILEVGGFLAAFPLAMKCLGFEVALAERYDYYQGAIDGIARYVESSGVQVVDADFTQALAPGSVTIGNRDAVTCMAVAEHLANSPKSLMENIYMALRPGGTLLFEVPNVAFWPKRFAFFVRGETVHAPIADVYHAAVPFTGHHREYTLDDARYVVHEAGFEIVSEETFNYGFDSGRLRNRIKYAPALLFKAWAELILIECRRPAHAA